MKDEYKTKKQLINELIELRKLIAESQTLITERKRAEEKIEEYTETLEEKIKERTGELQNANLELQALNRVCP
jgi:C4-dicarboxylate-specific signal transduction histidine kinase